MKRIASLILFGLLVFNLGFGGERQKIILDCDLGGDIDDAFAVAMMLAAQDEFDILFTVGPVPNMKDVIALDKKALSNAKHIYSMFGDYHFGAKEWNVVADIESSQAFISKIDNNITLSGVKVAGAIKWDDDRCRQVEN